MRTILGPTAKPWPGGLLLFRSRIPNFDSALKFKILPGDELKFRIHVRVNSMKQPKLALRELNRNIMRRCSRHNGTHSPDDQFSRCAGDAAAPRWISVWRRVRIVLRSSEYVRFLHRQFRVVFTLAWQMPDDLWFRFLQFRRPARAKASCDSSSWATKIKFDMSPSRPCPFKRVAAQLHHLRISEAFSRAIGRSAAWSKRSEQRDVVIERCVELAAMDGPHERLVTIEMRATFRFRGLMPPSRRIASGWLTIRFEFYKLSRASSPTLRYKQSVTHSHACLFL